MLNRWHSVKKLNRFWLAALLLAGIFVFFPFPVKAAEYNTVSSGDAFVYSYDSISDDDLEVYSDYGIMPLAIPSTYDIVFSRKYVTFNNYRFVPIRFQSHVQFNEPLNGNYKISCTLTPDYSYLSTSGSSLSVARLDLEYYIIVGGQKYYALNNTAGNVYFRVFAEANSLTQISFGVEGDLGFVAPDTYDAYVHCAFHISDLTFTKVTDNVAINYLDIISQQTTNTANYLYSLLTATTYNYQGITQQLTKRFDNVESLIGSLISQIVIFQKESHSDMSTLHTDLNTLHTDNTDWSSQFKGFVNDLWSNLTGWFNRQHQDLVNLLEETTKGYDNSSGNSENDRLSGALGGMDDAEGQITDIASSNLDKFNASDTLNFSTGMVSGLKLVKSFSESFFDSSGPLEHSVSVIYVMALLSIVVGLWRFVRK